jgi:hypothetical protein
MHSLSCNGKSFSCLGQSPPIMKHVRSLPCSQQPATTHYYPRAGESIACTRSYLFKNCVGSEVLTAVVMKCTILWSATPCSLLKVTRRFGRTYRFHLQSEINRTRYQRECGLPDIISQKAELFITTSVMPSNPTQCSYMEGYSSTH